MHYDACDDFTILSNDLTQVRGLTVCGLVRNEMYFLPAFLDHYRNLGVERFVLLDDQSDDGTRDYLAAQADVMTLSSGRRYGDTHVAETGPLAGKPSPMFRVWKTLLMQKFCIGQWALCLDADEFITLPLGWRFQDLIAKLPQGAPSAITGVMLDTYPANVSDLRAAGPFDPKAAWYADGQRHLVYQNSTRDFRLVYPGMRARLMYRFGMTKGSRLGRLKRLLLGRSPYPEFNEIAKIVLMNWAMGDVFLSSHRTTQEVNRWLLLPILHFKFTPDLYRRVMEAIADNQHFMGAVEYHQLHNLLTRMEAAGGSFLYRKSHHAADFEALRKSRNAILP